MGFSEMSEADIIKKIQELSKSGDTYSEVIKQHYEEIYRRFFSQCYNISRYYGLPRQDSEDAVQEAFIKLLKASSVMTFDPNRPFKPWFFKIVLNSVKDKYKEIIRHKYTDIEYAKDIPSSEQENTFEEFQMRDLFRSIIIKLPEKLKAAVILRNYTDLGLEAISGALNLSVRQLHNRLARAYQVIKKEMGGKENANG
jgi:RNA polymerase sigma-70 factor, ECF subfamily